MIEPPTAFSLLLSSLRGRRIYFEPLQGNNGDTLIQMGMRELFRRHDIKVSDDPESSEIVLLNGGGAMNDIWPEGAAQVLDSYIKRFPGRQFIVGPSSYHFSRLNLAEIVNQADTPVRLFCREERSLELLRKLDLNGNISLGLSPDLAFELEGSEFIKNQRDRAERSLVLCAMRKDREGNGGILAKTSASWLPLPVRKPLSRLRDRLVATKSSDLIGSILARVSPPIGKQEIVYRDISVSVGFDDFCDQVRRARVIITNRLHIAIFGSLLNKEVHLIRGSYHKIDGVYQLSLTHDKKVTLY